MLLNSFSTKDNFLAICLLEALDDENLSNAYALLLSHKANPYKVVLDREIAPIHYACGMENLNVAEDIVNLMLEIKGDVNVQTSDGETPLHIAAYFGRSRIVKMLLENGADPEMKDSDGNTPIHSAIQESHFHIIEIFRKHIFEQKYQTSKINNQVSLNEQNQSKLFAKIDLRTEEQIFTPNRINYNYDKTSPYYINITHRRRKCEANKLQSLHTITGAEDETSESGKNDSNNNSHSHLLSGNVLADRTISPDEESTMQENLFKLSSQNLTEFSKTITNNNSRKSLINCWRDKVNKSVHNRRVSSVRNLKDLDEFINKFKQIETENETSIQDSSETDDNSFKTAENNLLTVIDQSNFIRSPQTDNFIVQMTEEYLHSDNEHNILFIEKKTYANPLSVSQRLINLQSESSFSTQYTIPCDYDTEDLRCELTHFGDPPGPITKSTKRLYLKKLVKYKRNPNIVIQSEKSNTFSIELEKTLKAVNDCLEVIGKYSDLETRIIENFRIGNAKDKNIKLREGNLKKSFIYLLIDPRISENLPGESKLISKHETWKRFVTSIFYVGKGKSSRPYEHLYEAIKIFKEKDRHTIFNNSSKNSNGFRADEENIENNENTPHVVITPSNDQLHFTKMTNSYQKTSKKIQRIIEIWNSGKGVVCLHIFHNIMPIEAYTREAAIIECLGLVHLTNLKKGDYYGCTKTWNMRTRKQLGIYLLYKSLQVFIAEGESQLRPNDLK